MGEIYFLMVFISVIVIALGGFLTFMIFDVDRRALCVVGILVVAAVVASNYFIYTGEIRARESFAEWANANMGERVPISFLAPPDQEQDPLSQAVFVCPVYGDDGYYVSLLRRGENGQAVINVPISKFRIVTDERISRTVATFEWSYRDISYFHTDTKRMNWAIANALDRVTVYCAHCRTQYCQ